MKPITTDTTIEIMGKAYQIKCPETAVNSLQQAAVFLEQKMSETRDNSKVISIDRIAVITALNIAHQFLNLENHFNDKTLIAQQRLIDLEKKIETALAQNKQLELSSAE